MNIVEFANKVRLMRAAQKKYFKTRSPVDLVDAKVLELVVDKALADGVILRVTTTGPEMIVNRKVEEDHA
jgi:hypothetical protein